MAVFRAIELSPLLAATGSPGSSPWARSWMTAILTTGVRSTCSSRSRLRRPGRACAPPAWKMRPRNLIRGVRLGVLGGDDDAPVTSVSPAGRGPTFSPARRGLMPPLRRGLTP